MKKILDRIFTATAVLIMIILLGETIIQQHESFSYWENRNLTEPPAIKAESVLNGKWFADLEKYLSDHAAWREWILPADTRLNLHVFHRPVVNDIVVNNNEKDLLLPFLSPEAIDEKKIGEKADTLTRNLGRLADLTESYGGTYCYVAVPCQYAYDSDKYPFYVNDRSEYTAVSLRILEKALSQRDVHFLDLGKVFQDAGNREEYYSGVDNHFSMEGAYVAYDAILRELNRLAFSASDNAEAPDYPQLRILRKDEFVFSEIDAYYMGSRTRKLFNYVKNDEKLEVAEPVEPIPFERYDFGHTEPDWPRVYAYPQEGEAATYSNLYMSGDYSITRIETDRPELPTVLIYGDSFTNPVECLLYLSCDTMYSVDLRYYDDTTLSEIIRTEKPDYVFCLRDYESMLDASRNGGI